MLRRNNKIGEYTLLEKIGSGGFGDVWKAEKRTVLDVNHFALKFFRPKDDRIDLEKVSKELAVWKQLKGLPHIISVIELDQFEDYVYVVSDFADGGSLEEWLKNNSGKASSETEAIQITLQILTGLENLHEKGFVHRDIKPDNILIMNGKFCLADFGVSREIKTHSKATGTAGTMEYMPPEAFAKTPSVTPQTDIWAIGVILQKLLTGSLPYPQEDQPSLIGAILMSEPEPMPTNTSEGLREIVKKALQKVYNQRFQSAAEMRDALKNHKQYLLEEGKEKKDAGTIIDEDFDKTKLLEIEKERTLQIQKAEEKTEIVLTGYDPITGFLRQKAEDERRKKEKEEQERLERENFNYEFEARINIEAENKKDKATVEQNRKKYGKKPYFNFVLWMTGLVMVFPVILIAMALININDYLSSDRYQNAANRPVNQTSASTANYSNAANIGNANANAAKTLTATDYFNIAYKQCEEKDYDCQIKNYTNSIELDEDPPAFNNRGNAYRGKGEYSLALADYNKAISLYETSEDYPKSNLANSYNNRGLVYYQNLQNYDNAAIADFQKALELDPNHKKATDNLQNVLNKKRNAEHSGANTTANAMNSTTICYLNTGARLRTSPYHINQNNILTTWDRGAKVSVLSTAYGDPRESTGEKKWYKVRIISGTCTNTAGTLNCKEKNEGYLNASLVNCS